MIPDAPSRQRPLTQHITGLKVQLTRNTPTTSPLIFSADPQRGEVFFFGGGGLSLLRDFAAPPPVPYPLPRGRCASCSRTHQQRETWIKDLFVLEPVLQSSMGGGLPFFHYGIIPSLILSVPPPPNLSDFVSRRAPPPPQPSGFRSALGRRRNEPRRREDVGK